MCSSESSGRGSSASTRIRHERQFGGRAAPPATASASSSTSSSTSNIATGTDYDIAMTRAATLAQDRERRHAGATQQAGPGVQAEERARAHRSFALTAADGQCFGSLGGFSHHACGTNGTSSRARGGGRTPQFAVGTSGEECVRRCEECPRCGFASFSLLLRRCTWHGPERCDMSRLEKRWELWSYSTVRVRNASAVAQA